MILSYSDPAFMVGIKKGTKKHSLREDPKNRWRIGMTIHHWLYNPRHVHKMPHHFATDTCK